jgi:hypothetical protein
MAWLGVACAVGLAPSTTGLRHRAVGGGSELETRSGTTGADGVWWAHVDQPLDSTVNPSIRCMRNKALSMFDHR